MQSVELLYRSITEDRRASHIFTTKLAADAVNVNPRKFGQEFARRKEWLIRLARAQPAELAIEFAAIIATGLQLQQQQRKREDS